MDNRVRQHRIERHNAASLRAISGQTDVEYNGRSLQVARQTTRFYAPHLSVDPSLHSLGRCRGVADAIAFRLCFSDKEIYSDYCPEDRFAASLYDLLEQLRVEALVPKTLLGVWANMNQAFSEWCDESVTTGLTDNKTGLLIFTVAQMCRSRLTGLPQSNHIEGLIEATRAGISALIGHELVGLRSSISDQTAYAQLASQIAEKIAGLQKSGDKAVHDRNALVERLKLVLPPVADQEEQYSEDGVAINSICKCDASSLDEVSNYRVFSREYDVEVTADNLCSIAVQARLRRELDQLVGAQSVSVSRLALSLSWLLSDPVQRSWSFAEDAGLPDARRLTQLVCNPSMRDIFYRPKASQHSDAVVSFLIDNSGSMKKHRFATVAVYVDILSRALDLAGVSNEVLGFTTGGWSGGRVIKNWRRAGSPEYPGRLNEIKHIQYKAADKSWRQQRRSLSILLNTRHFKEGVDGEALIWAWKRVYARPESRKILLLISDGLPMDSSTAQTNGEHYLHEHLKAVVDWIEKESSVQLGAIGVGEDLSGFFSNSCQWDMQGALTNSSFRELEDLLMSIRRRAY